MKNLGELECSKPITQTTKVAGHSREKVNAEPVGALYLIKKVRTAEQEADTLQVRYLFIQYIKNAAVPCLGDMRPHTALSSVALLRGGYTGGDNTLISPPAHIAKQTVLVLVLVLVLRFTIRIPLFFPVSPVTLAICWLLMA